MADDNQEQEVFYIEALRKIEECLREKQTVLDLGRSGLVTVPPEIGQLTLLKELSLVPTK